ncbi:uncharacterized protein LOC119966630 isoform X2 [Scyliorhinus canicula]|uniref:uncharacterized protein LOC119966630 isoform X2 n=1 Tax=Scyliorhinus canicula TaxID=7830 RepID=UPI0018F74E49|nr:uncharacterized protein LOC119966630 isoform X2 [Scyliorhinus canicula]
MDSSDYQRCDSLFDPELDDTLTNYFYDESYGDDDVFLSNSMSSPKQLNHGGGSPMGKDNMSLKRHSTRWNLANLSSSPSFRHGGAWSGISPEEDSAEETAEASCPLNPKNQSLSVPSMNSHSSCSICSPSSDRNNTRQHFGNLPSIFTEDSFNDVDNPSAANLGNVSAIFDPDSLSEDDDSDSEFDMTADSINIPRASSGIPNLNSTMLDGEYGSPSSYFGGDSLDDNGYPSEAGMSADSLDSSQSSFPGMSADSLEVSQSPCPCSMSADSLDMSQLDPSPSPCQMANPKFTASPVQRRSPTSCKTRRSKKNKRCRASTPRKQLKACGPCRARRKARKRSCTQRQ